LGSSGEYNCTISPRRRCVPMSDYFDHLLIHVTSFAYAYFRYVVTIIKASILVDCRAGRHQQVRQSRLYTCQLFLARSSAEINDLSSPRFTTGHFTGIGRAIGPVCVCVCVCLYQDDRKSARRAARRMFKTTASFECKLKSLSSQPH